MKSDYFTTTGIEKFRRLSGNCSDDFEDEVSTRFNIDTSDRVSIDVSVEKAMPCKISDPCFYLPESDAS